MRIIEADGAKLEDAVWTVVKAGSVLGVFASEYANFYLNLGLHLTEL